MELAQNGVFLWGILYVFHFPFFPNPTTYAILLMTGEDTTQILQKVCLMQTQRGLVCRTDSLHLQLLTAMQSL